MDIEQKYSIIKQFKDQIIQISTDHTVDTDDYKHIINDVETFLNYNLESKRYLFWKEKLDGIRWNPYVYSIGGDDSDRIKEARINGVNSFLKILDSINTEISYEDSYKDSLLSSLISIFAERLDMVQQKLFSVYPESHQMIVSIDENLLSNNPEDWSNAVSSCRRLLNFVADRIYPPTKPKEINGKKRDLGPEEYKNRLIAYVCEKNLGEKQSNVLMTDIERTSKEMDAIVEAVNKGVHNNVTLDEAKMYVIKTILILGDILSL